MDFRRHWLDLIFAQPWQAVILITGLVASFGLALLVQRYETSAEQQRFERLADEVKDAVKTRLDTHQHLMESVRAAFLTDENVTAEEFRAIVASLNIREHPGVMAIGFVRRVPAAQLEHYLARVRQTSRRDFMLRLIDTPLEHEYRILEHSEAIQMVPPGPYGLDYGSEAVRRSATEAAMRKGKAVLSGSVPLMRSGMGHIFVLPVYRIGLPTDTEAQRRSALIGWVSMPVVLKEMMQDFAQKYTGVFDIELYDKEQRDPLFDLDAAHHAPAQGGAGGQFHASRNISIGGRQWLLEMRSLPGYEKRTDNLLPLTLLASGTIISLLLSLLVGLLRREGQESQRSLQESREYLRQVFQSSVDGIIVIDERGVIEEFNAAAEQLFGYRADEVVGRNVSMLMPSPYREQHDQYLARYLAGAPPRVIGIGREVTGLAKDGRRLELWLGISRFDLNGKIRFVGRVADISAHKRLQEELRQHRDHLQLLVDKRTAELRAAKEAAEQANRAKSAFFAQISHELRTPLHAIIGFTELGLEKGAQLPLDKLLDYFAKIHQAAERLLRMVNELLDLSKLEAGKMHFRFHRHDVLPALREVAVELRPLADKKSVSFTIESPDFPTTLICDVERMQQVFRNLLANAIRFSPEGGDISVHFSTTELPGRRADDPPRAALLITVADQGPGISPNELEFIFHSFEQGSQASSGEGTGLGLAISRQIVEA
ncbi:MAG: CHASE domain-containing protein, partial [Methylophilaceae bacterium]|nr:CHASE domain-containing protein [Methylophilaceae bacterium]